MIGTVTLRDVVGALVQTGFFMLFVIVVLRAIMETVSKK